MGQGDLQFETPIKLEPLVEANIHVDVDDEVEYVKLERGKEK